MDPTETATSAGSLLSNPSMVIVSVGAIAGLIAASHWMKAGKSIDASGHTAQGRGRSALREAAIWTAIALFVTCGGFLLGRLTGEF